MVSVISFAKRLSSSPVLVGAMLLSTVMITAACGESTPQATSPKGGGDGKANGDPSALIGGGAAMKGAPKPVTQLKRAQVKDTIAQGLGVFLQNVTVEDWPVMHDGKFYGFKIRTLNPEWGVDLKPGDVVTKINGIVPEHPEEADQALHSLEKAGTLKVDYERDGKAKTLELPIVD